VREGGRLECEMKYSVVIATYNRARDLRDTLQSLAGLDADGPWEVIVVDNNSPDDTRQVVASMAAGFPVELRYVFEREQGRSPALNAGIRAARGRIIATTDDDVRVERCRSGGLSRPHGSRTTPASNGGSLRCSTTGRSRSNLAPACRWA
jgi:hypothetical protein